MELSSSLDKEQFDALVQDALNRLYDSVYLQQHPLAAMLHDVDDGRLQRSQALRRAFLDAIHALRPAPGVPAHSPDWRGYRILELRYIEGASPARAMQALNLSRSQFFREQRRILDALTDLLWARWRTKLDSLPKDEGEQNAEIRARLSDASLDDLMRLEVERLIDAATPRSIVVSDLLLSLGSLFENLAANTSLEIQVLPGDRPVNLRVDPMLLRQSLLSTLNQIVRSGERAHLLITPFDEGDVAGIRLQLTLPTPVADWPGHLEQHLALAQQLVNAMDGELAILPNQVLARRVEIRFSWQAKRYVLLVVDDNYEFVELYRRFLAGRNWNVVGAHSGDEALRRLEGRAEDAPPLEPTLILLDVLMPREDSWQVLAELRTRPELHDVPIIICSVLNQPELAQAMGAQGYLRKPVTQTRLIEALEPYELTQTAVGSNEPGD